MFIIGLNINWPQFWGRLGFHPIQYFAVIENLKTSTETSEVIRRSSQDEIKALQKAEQAREEPQLKQEIAGCQRQMKEERVWVRNGRRNLNKDVGNYMKLRETLSKGTNSLKGLVLSMDLQQKLRTRWRDAENVVE